MAEAGTLHDAFIDELRDAYDAEKQLLKALPKLAKAASSPELRQAFLTHRDETQGQIERLEEVFASLDEKVRGKHCDGIAGIIEEGKAVMEEDFDEAAMDACLIASGQRAEHYEMAAYGTLVAWAKAMGHTDAADLLQQILDEEKAADEKLSELAESGINQEAASSAHPQDDARGEPRPGPRQRRRRCAGRGRLRRREEGRPPLTPVAAWGRSSCAPRERGSPSGGAHIRRCYHCGRWSVPDSPAGRMSHAHDLAHRHLAKVVESSDDAIVSKDLSSVIVSWNRAAERMFGYAAEEAIGRSIRMIIPADRQGEEDAVLEAIRAGRSVTHYETVRQRKDGSLIDISLTVSPIYDDAGVVIGASKIARDISAEKRAAFDIRRLAAVVESSDDAIVTKTLDGVITSWNRAAERMFGYTEAEAVGRSVRMLIPDERQSEEDTVLARLRAGLSIDHYETVRQRKDGSLAVDLADGLADPRRCGRDRRRLEDRPRHHRAGAPAAAGARARRDHREAVRGGRRRRLVARSRRHRPEGHRHGATS